jgi:phage terminase small subunit
MAEKLNMRQRKFAEYYAQSGNTVQSAINAGYSENYANTNACKLLENDRVIEYIKELSDRAQQERIINATERQAILSDIAKSKDEETSDRIRAIDTLNKMTGEYLNKVEVSGSLETEKSKLDSLIEQMSGNE